jgi:hypothetical protein
MESRLNQPTPTRRREGRVLAWLKKLDVNDEQKGNIISNQKGEVKGNRKKKKR